MICFCRVACGKGQHDGAGRVATKYIRDEVLSGVYIPNAYTAFAVFKEKKPEKADLFKQLEENKEWDLLKKYIGQNGHTGYYVRYSTADETEYGRLQLKHAHEPEVILKVNRDDEHFITPVVGLKKFRCLRATKSPMDGIKSEIRTDLRACFCDRCRSGTGCYHPEISGQGATQWLHKIVEKSFKCESTEKKVPKTAAAGEQVAPVEGPAAPAPPPVALDAPAAALPNDNNDSNEQNIKIRSLVEIRMEDEIMVCTSKNAGIITLNKQKLVRRAVVCTVENGGWFVGVVESQNDEHVTVKWLSGSRNENENVSLDRVKWCYNEKPSNCIVTGVKLPAEARAFFSRTYNNVE